MGLNLKSREARREEKPKQGASYGAVAAIDKGGDPPPAPARGGGGAAGAGETGGLSVSIVGKG
ncbi:MAG: hypothetical protein KY467_14570 [Gemmatimonadetes bacterium]|nr:hypothetical protein [Gemmatimonadota bacterium]